MPYYLRLIPSHVPGELWRIDERSGSFVAATQPQGPEYFFEAEPGEAIWDCIARKYPWNGMGAEPAFVPTELSPSQFYPRIARPLSLGIPGMEVPPYVTEDTDFIADARTQLIVLVEQMRRIFRTVHPAENTLSVYGHEIRNALILASTEVEMHWRGILRKNGFTKDRLKTTDYVVLSSILKLQDYEVSFPDYPSIRPISPYRLWGSSENTTQDIPWYDAYNNIKHDREAEFSRASLENALSAVTACAIIFMAQFGFSAVHDTPELRAFFRFAKVPIWSPGQYYLGNGRSDWAPVAHPEIAALT